MLYLIKSSNKHKIGFTENQDTLKGRLNSYRTHNPEFEFIGIRKGDRSEEKRLHREYKKYSLNNGNEWFDFEENIEEVECLFTKNDLEKEILLHFNLQVEELDEWEIGEIDDSFDYISNIGIFTLLSSNNKVYISFRDVRVLNNNKLFKVKFTELKYFFRDYDEYGECYRGFKIDENLYYNFRSRLYGESCSISNITTPLFKKIEKLLRTI